MTFEEIQEEAAEFTRKSELNQVKELGLKKIFDSPLAAALSVNDPIVIQLKEPQIIGKHHQLPVERLDDAATVISYFLPFSEDIRRANRLPGLPAESWLYGRIEGEQFNRALASHLADTFRKAGASADVPLLDPDIRISALQCRWSERHIAYAAGLGTFGISRSLITKRGCAGRYGSVITSLKIPNSHPRREPFLAYCSTCGACSRRCPAGAITRGGKDIAVCAQYQEGIKKQFFPRYGCGKCQTAVPCEDILPGC